MFLPLVQELSASRDLNRTSVLPACCETKVFPCMYLLAFIIFHVFSLLLEMTDQGTQAGGSSSRYVWVCGVDQDLMERLGGMEVRKKLGGRGQRRLVLDLAAPPPFLWKCLFLFFCKISGNDRLLGFFSLGSFSHLPFFALFFFSFLFLLSPPLSSRFFLVLSSLRMPCGPVLSVFNAGVKAAVFFFFG